MSRRERTILSGLAAACAFPLILALLCSPAVASVVRLGQRAALPSGSSLIGALAPATPMRITVALQPRDPAALTQRAIAVSRPGSPRYRHYLSVAQFRARFAPTSATVAAVRASLQSHGLRVGPLSAGGLLLPVSADAGTLARAFSIVFDRIHLPDGVSAIVNSLAPALDSRIAGAVQSVIGLNGLERVRPLLMRPSRTGARAVPLARPHVVTGGPQPCATANAAAPGQSAFTSDQIASAYDFSGAYAAGDQGAGVTIAVYELEPFSVQDIAAYQTCYGTHTQVTNVPVDGGAGTGAGSGESAFDIEQLIGLAPQANIIVYSGPNSNSNGPGAGPFDVLAAAVNQDKTQVISDSWGQCEPMEGSGDAHSEQTVTQQATVQGQTIVAASGDMGSEGCDAGALGNTSLATSDPATQPFVTGVGGTSLRSLGPPPGETAWNNGGNLTGLLGLSLGASGGGISMLWPMPGYQSGANPALGVTQASSSGRPCGAGSGKCRESPDVSADADPNTGYLIYYNGDGGVSGQPVGWQGSGGTSGSAPLWGALVALADASKGCAGAPVGLANPALYALAGSNYGRYFHDVTSGNNDMTASHGGLYPALTGYDMATGLGSPDAAQLLGGLCASSVRVGNPGTLSSSLGSHVTVRLAPASHPPGAVYSAQGLPPGLHIAAGSGIVTGTAVRAGRYSVKLLASGPSGQQQGVAFTWLVSSPPKLSAVNLAHVGSGTARLAFMVRSARGGPAISSLTISLPPRLVIGFGRALAVTGAGGAKLTYTIVPRGATISIQLSSPTTTAAVVAPLTVSAGFRSEVRRGQHPPVSVTITTADVHRAATALRARIRPGS